MKHKILLADESLTVQKVVSLTLDKSRYQLIIAKSRPEIIKAVIEHLPQLILVSDKFQDLQWQSFPKEVEAWLGRDHALPPVVLLTSQDIKEAKHYFAILRKPFSPQALLNFVQSVEFGTGNDEDDSPTEFITVPRRPIERQSSGGRLREDDEMERNFNNAFSNESELVEQTFKIKPNSPHRPIETEEVQWNKAKQDSSLWEINSMNSYEKSGVMGADDSMAYKAAIENRVSQELNSQDLEAMVEKVLGRIMPPIIERVVQDRLDQLLKEQENSGSL